ncbi:molecular chaperone GrpE [Actinopolymorpha cephalotaxi]|uniref:Protein GrpE n=1 Tax=Actinopolymorpha cephalotaxi TaxID=504797 RepID=A0A1I2PTN2_9ACTN|nr:nucleotide exchange factor GrpE [Actinopolymorpha cephalotaxi]NYH83501.1 molecular chaperone GrpE [Actinopolymorpha cephalotaxi]SFG18743.1 molecular chaperone GrpE [Actinopolymorpha cephalotaxi]
MSERTSQPVRQPAEQPDGGPAAQHLAGSPEVAELAKEVAALRDLFQRRLLEDQARQRMYDELYRQLEFARQGLVEEFVAPLAREILLVVDRIDALTGQVARDGNANDAADDAGNLGSVRAELLEILHRRGLREVDATGQEFDPRVHEAVARVPVEPGDQVGRVVEVRRPGYALADRLLRPAQVGVGYRPAGARS